MSILYDNKTVKKLKKGMFKKLKYKTLLFQDNAES